MIDEKDIDIVIIEKIAKKNKDSFLSLVFFLLKEKIIK